MFGAMIVCTCLGVAYLTVLAIEKEFGPLTLAMVFGKDDD